MNTKNNNNNKIIRSPGKGKKKKKTKQNKTNKTKQRRKKKKKKAKQIDRILFFNNHKKSQNWQRNNKPMCPYTSIFVCLYSKSFPLSFLSILGRKHFGRAKEKTPKPQQFFLLSPLQPNTYQKYFLPTFLSYIFHPL